MFQKLKEDKKCFEINTVKHRVIYSDIIIYVLIMVRIPTFLKPREVLCRHLPTAFFANRPCLNPEIKVK